MESGPLVSVIIPTFRRFGPLLDTIEDLRRQKDCRFELVIADQNESWPEEWEAARDKAADAENVKWLQLENGVVAARNEAVRQSNGEILLFVDDDVSIKDPWFIARHAKNYELPDVSAVLGCEIVEPDRERQSLLEAEHQLKSAPLAPPAAQGWSERSAAWECIHFSRDSVRRVWVASFCTCNASVRRTAFEAIGGFDESFAGYSYGDDYDFAIRFVEAGFRIVYDPTAALIHLKSPIGGLRINDQHEQDRRQFDLAVCAWLLLIRHQQRGVRRVMFFRYLLRGTVLLKRNLTRPDRQVKAWLTLLKSYRVAARRERQFQTSTRSA